jgi:hypothetical protein
MRWRAFITEARRGGRRSAFENRGSNSPIHLFHYLKCLRADSSESFRSPAALSGPSPLCWSEGEIERTGRCTMIGTVGTPSAYGHKRSSGRRHSALRASSLHCGTHESRPMPIQSDAPWCRALCNRIGEPPANRVSASRSRVFEYAAGPSDSYITEWTAVTENDCVAAGSKKARTIPSRS